MDLRPEAGYLLSGKYAEFGEILRGDSIESLQRFDKAIDVFINDSDHSIDYETREYQTIAPRLHAGSFIIGDNSHVTPALRDFAIATGRRFLFFHEKPYRHWYPGGGIGLAFGD